MQNNSSIVDLDQRLKALDSSASFIVQAPAGSGKTSLLTQRYLKLLGQAEYPEEIIAITFTKKAAAEMRGRILFALEQGEDPVPPESDHEYITWNLAKQALSQDKSKGWNLLSSPSRLRIMTIDSLSAWLAGQLPVVSQFGALHQVTESPEALYRQAVHQALQHLDSGKHWSDAIEHLIEHLDNNLSMVESLLMAMLARREQWLRHIQHSKTNPQMRQDLETALTTVVNDHLIDLSAQLQATSIACQVDLVRFAAGNVVGDTPIAFCRDLEQLPVATAENINQWLGLATLFLTNDGQWRKQVTKAVGFPAPSSAKNAEEKACYQEMKERMSHLLADLQGNDEFCRKLDAVRSLPSVVYSEAQWLLLEALFDLLPLTVAELYLVFSEHGRVDFSEVSKSAIEALGEPDAPTDLALILDYRIQHIMVDEFQDTSFGQFQLLERLTAGWTGEDGRTLFLVGDPMQSIYRFREAEVSFFLWVRTHGIGALRLQSLNLTVNFRSQRGIVEWVNQVFIDVLPKLDDILSGAVAYSRSFAYQSSDEGDAVEIFPFYENSLTQEALATVGVIKKIKQQSPEGTIAVLVQARSHLRAIVAELKYQQIPFQAIDVDALYDKPAIQDLLSLTRGLLHPGDKVAWLSLLRAPWCGLSLGELEWLVGGHEHATVWQCLNRPEFVEKLSDASQKRVGRFVAVMKQALARRGRCALRRLIESAWFNLGGAACVSQYAELEDVEVFFRLIDTLEQTEKALQFSLIEEKVRSLFAQPDVNADTSLQLMTIHKSKGLEFDHVLLPGLGRKIASNEKRLLLWMECPSEQGVGDLLLAPLSASGEVTSNIYNYLRLIDQSKLENESARLLYVAVTRAKKKLYLFGHTTAAFKDGELILRAPHKASMLAKLWRTLENCFIDQLSRQEDAESTFMGGGVNADLPILHRLSNTWQLPKTIDRLPSVGFEGNIYQDELVEFTWVSPTARYVGILVHFMLMRIAIEGVDSWSVQRVCDYEPRLRQRLIQQGVSYSELDQAVGKVSKALVNVLSDTRGRWILRGDRQDCYCEYAISGRVAGNVLHGIVDRTFVDEVGTRWIIDYKTADYQGDDVNGFLNDEQVRYQHQLKQYAQLLRHAGEQPIKLGLYFPLIQSWREWAY